MGIELGEEFLRGLRDQLTERKENMVWRAFSLMYRDGSKNSKSGFGKFISGLWYLLEKFQIRDDFSYKVSLCQHSFTKIWSLWSKEWWIKFREKMHNANKIPGDLSTHRTIIFPISPSSLQLNFNYLIIFIK